MVNHLMSDPAITAMIGDRLYPLAIPETGKVPAIVYQRISAPRTLSLTGESGSSPRIQLSCYAPSYKQAKQMAMVLAQSLDYLRGTLGGRAKAAVLMAGYREDYEPETGRYRSDVDFFIMHSKQFKGE